MAKPVQCRFCGADGDGHLFWECTSPPLVEIRENPELHGLVEISLTGRGVLSDMDGWSEWWLSLGGESC